MTRLRLLSIGPEAVQHDVEIIERSNEKATKNVPSINFY